MKFNLVSVFKRIGGAINTAKNSLKISQFIFSGLRTYPQFIPNRLRPYTKYIPSDANLNRVGKALEIAGDVTENILHRHSDNIKVHPIDSPYFGGISDEDIAIGIVNKIH